MRKNKEQFMELIEEKCDILRAEKRKKRARVMSALIPAAACFLVACALLISPVLRLIAETGDEGSEEKYQEIFPVSVGVSVLSGSGKSDLNYTNREKMSDILSYFSALRLKDIPDFYDDKPNSDSESGVTYSVTVKFSDGSELVYIQSGDSYLRVNGGAWKEIARTDGDAGLGALLSGLSPDE